MPREGFSVTGNALKDKLLLLVVSGVRLDREHVTLLHDTREYVNKAIRELREEGVIKVTKEKPRTINLTAKGIELLSQKDKEAHAFYMRYSNNHHPGSTTRHQELFRRASQIMTAMAACDVLVGPQKPSLENIVAGKEAQLKQEVATFYLNKEIKYSRNQLESRVQQSRANGVVLSKGIRALAYNTLDRPLKITKLPEREANIRLVQVAKEVYRDLPFEDVKDSIVFCESDKDAVNIFNTRSNDKGKTKFIGDAIWDKSVTGVGFRYIPLSKAGMKSLRLITTYTRKDFLTAFFSPEERAAAVKQGGGGEGVIAGLTCFEFVSCNVSKLAYIKRTHKDLENIGLVCCEEQKDFVATFMNFPGLHIRCYSDNDINEMLQVNQNRG